MSAPAFNNQNTLPQVIVLRRYLIRSEREEQKEKTGEEEDKNG